MTLDQRKDNTYFDKNGKQILVGDLLKVFHFRTRKKIHYLYRVVVMDETHTFPVMAFKEYYEDKPHCPMFLVASNAQRVYHDAEIISEKDWETKRKKIKVIKETK